jgi:HSF-type DNA-binding
MTYKAVMVPHQISHHINDVNDDDTNSSGTTVLHENRNEYISYIKGNISSATKKLVFTSETDGLVDDKENDPFGKGALKTIVNYLDFKDYNHDLMNTVDLSPKESHDDVNNDDLHNEIGEYEDDCTEDGDDDDDDLHSPIDMSSNSLTPIPVHHRPSTYPPQYHAARYGIYPQNLQQSQPFNGYYYSPPPIYPYVSSISQLPYFSSSSTGVRGEELSRQPNTTTSDTTAAQRTGRHRGGVAEPFPEKLYRMLDTCEKEGKTDVVSFSIHGNTFAIHKPKRFTLEVMSRFFKQSKLTSFQRQLNLYGFKRISSGPDNGSYWVRTCEPLRACLQKSFSFIYYF